MQKFKKKKSVACRRCHAHKVKCCGEKPCTKCRLAGCAEECKYVVRDRQVRVNESYLEQVLSENQRLKRQLNQVGTATPLSQSETHTPQTEEHVDDCLDSDVRNPLLGTRAWFQPYDPSVPPIYIGEAACTAFATRLRQFLTGNPNEAHNPRTQYVEESTLLAFYEADIGWPSHAQARLLVKIAFNQVSRVYHLLLRTSTLNKLDEIYRTSNFHDPVLKCKFFALFALGEVYSGRSDSTMGCRVPGTAYYVRAMTMIPILPERPSLMHIECLLLLSLYSYFLNRRHAGFVMIGNAMRLALTLGLNHNIPERQCMDPTERQHRIRIWWAIYVFDRMWGSKTGFPIEMMDDDIHVDMPSKIDADSQFGDPEYFIASITLARITGQVIDKVYSRKKHPESFLHREQQLLISLKGWVQSLPSGIKLSSDRSSPKHVLSLHLQFNQCMILATRPILLHALICLRGRNGREPLVPREKISQTAITLSEACIHAARHSHSLITEEWIEGSLPIFGYFYAQYLFSAALILVISSLIPIEISNLNDLTSFETAIEILRSMSEHGNLAATEFYENLVRVKKSLAEETGQGLTDNTSRDFPGTAIQSEGMPELQSSSIVSLPDMTMDPSLFAAMSAENLTTEMALSEPMMQDFLAQSHIDIGLLNSTGTLIHDANSLFTITPNSLWTL